MSLPFSVVFSGGGCRSFWSLGVYRALASRLPPICEIAGVSAGAAMGLAVACDTVDRMLEIFLDKTSTNRRNFYPERLVTRRPAFPHEQMYRSTIAQCLAEGGWQRLSSGPQLRILQAYVAPGFPVVRTVFRAFRAYAAGRKHGEVHGPELPCPGIGEEVQVGQDADSPEALIDCILRSSASPPVTTVSKREGRTYFDGSLIDSVPVRALSETAQMGKALVLLTRRYPEEALPKHPTRLYLMPRESPPIHKWDYTSPDRIGAALSAGRQDAAHFEQRLQNFTGSS